MSTVEISLGRGLVTLVDTADAERVQTLGSWHTTTPCANGLRYARHTIRERVGDSIQYRGILMHRLLTGWDLVDHINGNGLDNRRSNLRPAEPWQNSSHQRKRSDNTSGFKGVTFHRQSGRWRAAITAQGEVHSLGLHATPEAAAHAYDVAALEIHGAFAVTNFPVESYDDVGPLVVDRPPVLVSPERLDQVRVLARQGLAAKAIGAEIGIRTATVQKWMTKYGIPSSQRGHQRRRAPVAEPPVRARERWEAWEDALVMAEPAGRPCAADLAARLGRSHEAVLTRRKILLRHEGGAR